MKKILSRSVMTFLYIGALMMTAQTWAHDDENKVLTRTTESKDIVKNQAECEKYCKEKNEDSQHQHEDSQHQHEDSSEMLKMDDSNVKPSTKSR